MGAYELNEVLLPGDVDGNQAVNMADAILALRILAGMNSGITVNMGGDVNGDGRIGFAEALYVIQFEAGLRIP
jgi:hypothetical protein